MSSVLTTSRIHALRQPQAMTASLSWLERGVLALGVIEIPLQIDTYLMYREADANLGAVAGINISLTTLAIAVLYVVWLAQNAVHKQRTRMPLMLGMPMLVYGAAVLFSVGVAEDPALAIFDFTVVFQAYLLFFYIANRIRTQDDILFCVLVLAVGLMIESLLIIAMAALRLDDSELTIGPMVLSAWAGNRQAGTMQSAVLAGSTMALMWLPVATLLLCRPNRYVWQFVFATTCAGLLAILLTQTRGALLTSVVGSLVIGIGLLIRGWLPNWTVALAAILAVISVYPLVVLYEKRVKSGDGESAIARKHLTLIALDMIADRPLLGFGAGNCHLAGQSYANQELYRSEWYYTIHCKYLLVWIENGVIGFLAFLALLGNAIRQGIAVWRTRNSVLAPLGLALSAAIAGHGLHLAVDIFNSRSQVQMLWVVLGLTALLYKLVCLQPSQETADRSRVRSLAGGTI